MRKLLALTLILGSILQLGAQERVPFAPKGSSWKYWFADEYSTGYINVVVVSDNQTRTGYISGDESHTKVTVPVAEINTSRAAFSFASMTSFEERHPDSLNKDKARYMFREGNKAYLFDHFDSTFYKLIDMDAQPGDKWEMSLFNGSYERPWSHVEFYQDTTQAVPAELLPYWADSRFTHITDDNWACFLTYPPFADSLLSNGITQAQIDDWISKYAKCVTTGPALGTKDDYASLYNAVKVAMTNRGYAFSDDTWACDFTYIDQNVYKFSSSADGISYSTRSAVAALCDTRMNYMTEWEPMPDEIARLWKHMEPVTANDGNPTNYNFRLVTRFNWPRYATTEIMREIAKPVEEGGLGLTEEEANAKYKDYAEFKYDSVPVPGDVDLIEVTEKMSVEVNGQSIPVITMGPACESLLDDKAIRSELDIFGQLNIDYLNLTAEPWVQTLDNSSSYEIHYHGLLCATNGDKFLETPNLDEYFEKALPNKNVEASCGEIEAPKFNIPASDALNAKAAGDNTFGQIDNSTQKSLVLKSATAENMPAQMTVNAVVHVIYNENEPASKVSESMINAMIDAINDAFTGTNDQSDLNAAFTDVVGAPNIVLKLATTDANGNPTNGIEYYSTEEDFYTVGSGTSIQEQYAYKFNDIGAAVTWDHTRYLNIYIADFGTDEGYNVGGFVTNPVATNTNKNDMYKWYESNDLSYWRGWLNNTGGDAPALDGLSLDYYATFYGDSISTLKYKTAIHELGHYFGLRHSFSTLVDKVSYNEFGIPITKEVLYGDNFNDTPEQYYKTLVYDDCNREPYQCGHLVMVNNFMDYSLPCACAFTKEQSAFMRYFTTELRPGIFTMENPSAVISGKEAVLNICPNPTSDVINITLDSEKPFSVVVYNMQGQKVDELTNVVRVAELSLLAQPSGVYTVTVITDGNLVSIEKVIKK